MSKSGLSAGAFLLLALIPSSLPAHEDHAVSIRVVMTSPKTAEVNCFKTGPAEEAVAELRANKAAPANLIPQGMPPRSMKMRRFSGEAEKVVYIASFNDLASSAYYQVRCRVGGEWSHWTSARTIEDLYPATSVPDRVILTWEDDPATSFSVTWRTDLSVKAPVAEIAPVGDNARFPMEAKRVAAESQRYDTLERGPVHTHAARFAGLRPDTLYAYRVGEPFGSWSEWLQFRTAADRPAPFSFLYFGDVQNDIRSNFSRVLRQAARDAPDARFIVYAGDLVERGDSEDLWGQWHEAGGWLNGMIPSVPAIGNHEYIKTTEFFTGPIKFEMLPNWRANFALPQNGPPGLEERVYYIDYQGVRVIALDSVVAQPDPGRGGTVVTAPGVDGARLQAEWLEKVLSNNPNRWTIIAFHYPLISLRSPEFARDMRAAWQPIFDKYGVDLVLQGHEHVYARGRATTASTSTPPVYDANTGAVYVQSVGNGWPLTLGGQTAARPENVAGYQWSGDQIQLYQVVRIDGDRLSFEAHLPNGAVYDAFDLVKGAPGAPNQLVERQKETPRLQLRPVQPIQAGEFRVLPAAALKKFVGEYSCFEGIYYDAFKHKIALAGDGLRMSLTRTGGSVTLRPVSDLAFAGVSDEGVTVRARFAMDHKGVPVRLEVQEGEFYHTVAERRP